jgi:hypothetical protein
MTAIAGIKQALVASLGDLYSREDGSLAVAEQEAIANVIESLFTLPEIGSVSPIRAASRNGLFAAIDALSTESDWYQERRSLSAPSDLISNTDEEKPPYAPPDLYSLYANTKYVHSWSSGLYELVLSEDVPANERAVLGNHVSPWMQISYGGEKTFAFQIGVTELL